MVKISPITSGEGYTDFKTQNSIFGDSAFLFCSYLAVKVIPLGEDLGGAESVNDVSFSQTCVTVCSRNIGNIASQQFSCNLNPLS